MSLCLYESVSGRLLAYSSLSLYVCLWHLPDGQSLCLSIRANKKPKCHTAAQGPVWKCKTHLMSGRAPWMAECNKYPARLIPRVVLPVGEKRHKKLHEPTSKAPPLELKYPTVSICLCDSLWTSDHQQYVWLSHSVHLCLRVSLSVCSVDVDQGVCLCGCGLVIIIKETIQAPFSPVSTICPLRSTLTSDEAVISWYSIPNGLMRKWSSSWLVLTCNPMKKSANCTANTYTLDNQDRLGEAFKNCGICAGELIE